MIVRRTRAGRPEGRPLFPELEWVAIEVEYEAYRRDNLAVRDVRAHRAEVCGVELVREDDRSGPQAGGSPVDGFLPGMPGQVEELPGHPRFDRPSEEIRIRREKPVLADRHTYIQAIHKATVERLLQHRYANDAIDFAIVRQRVRRSREIARSDRECPDSSLEINRDLLFSRRVVFVFGRRDRGRPIGFVIRRMFEDAGKRDGDEARAGGFVSRVVLAKHLQLDLVADEVARTAQFLQPPPRLRLG